MGNLIRVSPRASSFTDGVVMSVADLGFDLQTARAIGVVQDLSGNNWIDRRTRATNCRVQRL